MNSEANHRDPVEAMRAFVEQRASLVAALREEVVAIDKRRAEIVELLHTVGEGVDGPLPKDSPVAATVTPSAPAGAAPESAKDRRPRGHLRQEILSALGKTPYFSLEDLTTAINTAAAGYGAVSGAHVKRDLLALVQEGKVQSIASQDSVHYRLTGAPDATPASEPADASSSV